jgi:ABC-2 type transport system permease protein
MNKFFESTKKFFSKKQFKYGGYSLLVTLVGIALVVLVNYGLTVLEKNFDLRLDTTQNKKYSLADQTKKIVSGLDKDIYIYTTYAPGQEDKDVNEILQKFKGLSGHVYLQNVDPDLNPVFMQKFKTGGTAITSGDVIVSDKDAKLFRVLDSNALYQYSYDSNTGSTTKTQIKAEGAVVTAINYLKLGYIPTVYLVQGHGEPTTADLTDISASMSAQNYNFVTINIASAPDKIKAGDTVMIFNPQKDITDAERDILKPLMQKGGRFYILLDPQYAGPGKMPNIESLLRLYDIGLKSGVIIEGNTANMITPQAPFALVPDIQAQDITNPIKTANYPLVLPYCGALELPGSPPDSSTTITSLLKTSDKAYLKSYDSLSNAKSVEDLAKKPEDTTGPFDMAVAVEKTNGSNAEDNVKLVVAYSTEFASTSGLIASNAPYEDNDLFMNSVGWMRNADQDIYVRPKSISAPILNISNLVEFWGIAIVAVILVPLIMLVIGIVVYQRRKHL